MNLEELERVLVELVHSRDRLEENRQTGTVYHLQKAIKHLSEVIDLMRKQRAEVYDHIFNIEALKESVKNGHRMDKKSDKRCDR